MSTLALIPIVPTSGSNYELFVIAGGVNEIIAGMNELLVPKKVVLPQITVLPNSSANISPMIFAIAVGVNTIIGGLNLLLADVTLPQSAIAALSRRLDDLQASVTNVHHDLIHPPQ